MSRTVIKVIPYDEVNFKWISNHWDVHLSGTCIYNGELCEFENSYPMYNEDTDEYEEMLVKIYKLDLLSKLAWMKRQWGFEKCVGYHWTYINGARSYGFKYRKPEWFYKRLLNWYYSIKKKKNK